MKVTAAILAILPIVACKPVQSRWGSGNPDSLGGLAEAKGKKWFGTAMQSWYMANEHFASILRQEFNQITPEGEMKWTGTEPERGVFNWTGGDLIVEIAKQQNAYVRGHNICWDSATPDYVLNTTDPDELRQILKEHIDAVMGRYKNDVYAFDIVNEPVNDGNGTWKENHWYTVLGESYVETALRYAHAAAPDVKLYINDYNISGIDTKSTAIYNIAKDLLNRDVPLHGIGLQGHYAGNKIPSDITQNMQRFVDLGLEVGITEFDVRLFVNDAGAATFECLQVQAEAYRNVVQACLNVDGCVGLTVWGFDDYYSWIAGFAKFSEYGAATLYDQYFHPKPALAAVRNQLRS